MSALFVVSRFSDPTCRMSASSRHVTARQPPAPPPPGLALQTFLTLFFRPAFPPPAPPARNRGPWHATPHCRHQPFRAPTVCSFFFFFSPPFPDFLFPQRRGSRYGGARGRSPGMHPRAPRFPLRLERFLSDSRLLGKVGKLGSARYYIAVLSPPPSSLAVLVDPIFGHPFLGPPNSHPPEQKRG